MWVDGWVDFTPIIKPLRGPTCVLKTSKISTQVGPECGNILDTFLNFKETFKQLREGFKKKVKLGLLAEVRAGGHLIGLFLIKVSKDLSNHDPICPRPWFSAVSNYMSHVGHKMRDAERMVALVL